MIVVGAALAACGQPEPKTPQHSYETNAAVAAVQQGKLDVAMSEASAMLAREPRNSQAAAVHAIARYQAAGSQLFGELRVVLDEASSLKFFDHEKGRAAWRAFISELDAVDRDLEIAAADPGFSLEVCVACWEPRDWNHNGRIDDGDRRLFELEYDGKGGVLPPDDPRRKPSFRFDHGDVLWARAMIAFQRAGVELVLAYRWSELDKLFAGGDELRMNIKLIDPGRAKRARELVLAGLTFADETRLAYLRERDDDHEWVPNPRQKSYAMPLVVTAELYTKWEQVIGDVRNLLESKEGLSLRELATAATGPQAALVVPDVYVDLGRMLREPTDIVVDLDDNLPRAQKYERMFRGLLGHGYTESMRASPLVGRLRHMHIEVQKGDDTLQRKLRYLLWLN
jgi:hypothetical protein